MVDADDKPKLNSQPLYLTSSVKYKTFKRLSNLGLTIWGFTESDFSTFVIPATLFGVLGGLAGNILSPDSTMTKQEVLLRAPLVLVFNWYTTLIVDIDNQRASEAIIEDRINKPTRPIAAGQITPDQARRWLLYGVPIALALDYMLGTWNESIIMITLSYLYNNLGGCDELVMRDLLLAAAYATINAGSLHVATGQQIRNEGLSWIGFISGVMLFTIHIQDFRDMKGDRERGRLTLPLLLGGSICRVVSAVVVTTASFACAYFWRPHYYAVSLSTVLGLVVVGHVLLKRESEDDKRSYKIWALWLVSLYCVPFAVRIGL
jgi:4-hydroxybenzoate polyprenyltransferase